MPCPLMACNSTSKVRSKCYITSKYVTVTGEQARGGGCSRGGEGELFWCINFLLCTLQWVEEKMPLQVDSFSLTTCLSHTFSLSHPDDQTEGRSDTTEFSSRLWSASKLPRMIASRLDETSTERKVDFTIYVRASAGYYLVFGLCPNFFTSARPVPCSCVVASGRARLHSTATCSLPRVIINIAISATRRSVGMVRLSAASPTTRTRKKKSQAERDQQFPRKS